jgi:DNA-binding transcriptional regulator YhcF (GntR family)
MVRFSADKPIYAQIIDLMSARIVTGIYELGSQLPTVRDLAMELGVNPNTVQRALADLEQQGFVRSERTAGRFVTEDKALLKDARNRLTQSEANAFVSNMKRFGCSGDELAKLVRRCANDTEQQHEKKEKEE